ncbi:MAG: Zn-dependent hydrolase [Oceanospirillaceae bacterium]|uniref:MBL fold metallo-hydrolase n=1 Tax=unclassified Thalassolituus TaxID=2624967 RepID=UPI000C5A54FC|nr:MULTISPECIES: MBL fold metallo-hydrolase [unclassified Thalassolituus]MAS26631.1 Zn-dependent hydrolase [Oceanospirillaceae bacterium]MAY00004.1 Zn-dependent hydrolase [Oceanospirillaceae bacterium]MBS51552.1 Zn-dependent hydrolase [Oceanospirillaceae bacterium]
MQIHTLKGYIQNIYLVEYPDKLLLLDGCSRADTGMVCDFIQTTLQRPLTDLKLIVVTHMHPDHAGGAHRLRRLTGAEIAAHPGTRKWYAGPVGRVAHAIDVALTLWVAGRMGRGKKHIWYNAVLQPDYELQDGQTLPGFSEWQALFTPGHTDHDVSLLHVPGGEIYVADLLVMVKQKIVPPYPLCHPNQYRRSLQKVAELNAERIYFAHLAPRSSNDVAFETLLSNAPKRPKTHWYSTKNKIAGRLSRRSRNI